MVEIETIQTVPLTITNDGTIRIEGSRVTLDSVIHHYKLGATAETIADKFPTLALSDIYAAIRYYLEHKKEVEEYLSIQKEKADEIRQMIEANQDRAAIRERLLNRAAQKERR
jgi:uncharacterized protein (DUF433 family)